VVRFIGQPFIGSGTVGGALDTALRDPALMKAWFATAWAKKSGMSRIVGGLAALHRRGGTGEIIVGVDEGGATLEGLHLAMRLFDTAWVFHDPGTRTFHPKLYVVEGRETATAIVGSGNMTMGGLYENYEAGLVLDLDRHDEQHEALLASLRSYYDALLGTAGACRPLDTALIDALRLDPKIVVESERANRRRRQATTSQASGSVSLFGPPIGGLARAPSAEVTPIDGEDFSNGHLDAHGLGDDRRTPPATAPAPPAPAAAPAPAPAGGGFFKALAAFDVSANAPGQILIPKRFVPFFGPLSVELDESATGGPRREAATMAVLFRDGSFAKAVPEGRVIRYQSAASNKRKSIDMRFTFHDSTISKRLSEDDVLVFSRATDGMLVVDRRPAGWRPKGVPATTRFGHL
jgi:hypothetical protein